MQRNSAEINASFPSDAASVFDLARWLNERGINTDCWNSGNAKSVDSLLVEIKRGETILELNPLRRVVNVVRLQIEQDGFFLVELSQSLQGGRTRVRNLLPSEKLYPNEHPVDGAARCIEEELGLCHPKSELTLIDTHRAEKSSSSYPGLKTLYTIHTVALSSPFHSLQDFIVPNMCKTDPVLSHTWGWRKPNFWLQIAPC